MLKVYKIRAIIWLALAVILAIIWLFLWLNADANAQARLKKFEPIHTDVNLPTKIKSLDELSGMLSDVNYNETTLALHNYPDEFKDRKFFEKHKDEWTVRIMSVTEQRVILDYLKTRPDRKDFAYFRHTDSDGVVHYVLTYKQEKSFIYANGIAKTVDFGIDKDRILPEAINRYLDIIDDYRITAPITKPAPIPVIIQEVEPEGPVPADDDAPSDIKEIIEVMPDAPNTQNIKPAPTAAPIPAAIPLEDAEY